MRVLQGCTLVSGNIPYQQEIWRRACNNSSEALQVSWHITTSVRDTMWEWEALQDLKSSWQEPRPAFGSSKKHSCKKGIKPESNSKLEEAFQWWNNSVCLFPLRMHWMSTIVATCSTAAQRSQIRPCLLLWGSVAARAIPLLQKDLPPGKHNIFEEDGMEDETGERRALNNLRTTTCCQKVRKRCCNLEKCWTWLVPRQKLSRSKTQST